MVQFGWHIRYSKWPWVVFHWRGWRGTVAPISLLSPKRELWTPLGRSWAVPLSLAQNAHSVKSTLQTTLLTTGLENLMTYSSEIQLATQVSFQMDLLKVPGKILARFLSFVHSFIQSEFALCGKCSHIRFPKRAAQSRHSRIIACLRMVGRAPNLHPELLCLF